jgi:membrane protein implicated in regulation of membrane protease activity
MNDLGKFLVIAGTMMILAGVLLWSGFGKGWLGRLPGDVHYSKGDFHFYFPIVTCLIVSVILTLLLRLFGK